MVSSWTCFMFVTIVVAKAQITRTKFSCNGRTSGYYADVSSGCQIYHMCDGLGRQFTYTCPNATLFQQRMLICDHWYMVNCSKSESDFGANLLIGQREKPFVDNSGANPYYRTPRPDLLSHPSESELNIIYRTGRAHNNVDSDSDNTNVDEEPFALPTRWSTEYSKTAQGSTPRSPVKQEKAIDFSNSKNILDNGSNAKRRPSFSAPVTQVPVNYQSNFKATTPVFPLTVDANTESPEDLLPPVKFPSTSSETPEVPINVNFRSNFKATTPVYPKSVDASDNTPQELLPPLPYKVPTVIEEESIPADVGRPEVRFESHFPATTPVYPTSVNASDNTPQELLPPLLSSEKNQETVQEEERPHVNFQSNFKATTPVYPETVDVASSQTPDDLLPPPSITNGQNKVNFRSNFKATTPVYPLSVESTSVAPSDLGILPPDDPEARIDFSDRSQIPTLDLDILPPPVDTNFKRNLSEVVIPETPSKFYQPPKFQPDYTQVQTDTINRDGLKSLNSEQWNDLRKKFLIPDYEFPLEQGTRPSYDSVFSSFQARNLKKKK